MNREKIEKERELEKEIAERSRKSLLQASKQDYGTSGATSVKVKEKEEKDFKTPGEQYQKNADRIQVSSGGQAEKAMQKFKEREKELAPKVQERISKSLYKSKDLGRSR